MMKPFTLFFFSLLLILCPVYPADEAVPAVLPTPPAVAPVKAPELAPAAAPTPVATEAAPVVEAPAAPKPAASATPAPVGVSWVDNWSIERVLAIVLILVTIVQTIRHKKASGEKVTAEDTLEAVVVKIDPYLTTEEKRTIGPVVDKVKGGLALLDGTLETNGLLKKSETTG